MPNSGKTAIAGLRQMARLAGTDYGGRMQDLVLLEKTYIRSRTDYAGESWFPAACQTALNLLDVVQRTASRWVTGATRNTNGDILHLQIRAPPARTRSKAGKFFERCKSQPPQHPIRQVTDRSIQRRLKSTRDVRSAGEEVSTQLHLNENPREGMSTISPLPPWASLTNIRFISSHKDCTKRTDPPERRKNATKHTIKELPQAELQIWTDGSANSGTEDGGSRILIYKGSGEKRIRLPAGKRTSSFQAELVALEEHFARYKKMRRELAPSLLTPKVQCNT